MKKIVILILLLAVCGYGADDTTTVCPEGCDYTQLSVAVQKEETDLTTLEKRKVFLIKGDQSAVNYDSVAVTIDAAGWTNPTSDYYVYILTDSEARHPGYFDTDYYVLKVNAQYVIVNEVEYTRLEGLLINHATSADQYTYAIYDGTTANITISDCIIKDTDGHADAHKYAMQLTAAGGNKYLINNIIYDYISTNDRGVILAGGDDASFVLNNTFINCQLAVNGPYHDVLIQNCIFEGCVNRTNAEDFADGCDYNTTDSSSFEYTDSPANDSVDASFSFVGAEDFHFASQQHDNGVDLSGTFTTDIDGDTRSGWNRGADEYVAAEPAEGRRRIEETIRRQQ